MGGSIAELKGDIWTNQIGMAIGLIDIDIMMKMFITIPPHDHERQQILMRPSLMSEGLHLDLNSELLINIDIVQHHIDIAVRYAGGAVC
ncbi:hypothetical protein D3C77_363910 [compost metagenome]